MKIIVNLDGVDNPLLAAQRAATNRVRCHRLGINSFGYQGDRNFTNNARRY